LRISSSRCIAKAFHLNRRHSLGTVGLLLSFAVPLKLRGASEKPSEDEGAEILEKYYKEICAFHAEKEAAMVAHRRKN